MTNQTKTILGVIVFIIVIVIIVNWNKWFGKKNGTSTNGTGTGVRSYRVGGLVGGSVPGAGGATSPSVSVTAPIGNFSVARPSPRCPQGFLDYGNVCRQGSRVTTPVNDPNKCQPCNSKSCPDGYCNGKCWCVEEIPT